MAIEAQCPAMTHAWKISWYLREKRGWGRPVRTTCHARVALVHRVRAESGRECCSRDLAKQPYLAQPCVRQGLAHNPACAIPLAQSRLHNPACACARQGLARELYCSLPPCEVGD